MSCLSTDRKMYHHTAAVKTSVTMFLHILPGCSQNWQSTRIMLWDGKQLQTVIMEEWIWVIPKYFPLSCNTKCIVYFITCCFQLNLLMLRWAAPQVLGPLKENCFRHFLLIIKLQALVVLPLQLLAAKIITNCGTIFAGSWLMRMRVLCILIDWSGAGNITPRA